MNQTQEERDGDAAAATVPRSGDLLETYGPADFEWGLFTLEGDTTSLRSFAGDVLFINLWATWCAPCVAELASIERLRDSLGDAPVTFLIVSPEPVERVAAFVNRHGYRLPFHVERREMPAAFDLRALPTTYIVDANGQIVLRHRGAADWADDDVRAFLQYLVGSAGPASAGPTGRGTVAP